MTDCDRIGIGGGCGFDCQVFLRGECTIAGAIAEDANEEDYQLYLEIYDPENVL